MSKLQTNINFVKEQTVRVTLWLIKRHTNPAHPITLKHFAPSYNFIFCLPEQGQGPIVVVSSILQVSLNQLPFLQSGQIEDDT